MSNSFELSPTIVVKLLDGGIMPSKADGNPVGLDIYCSKSLLLFPNQIGAISTGLILTIPIGYYATIEERSGMSLNTPLSLKAGIIDQDYRGEIKVVFQNISKYPFEVKSGDKIAQLIFHKQVVPEFIIARNPPDPTVRGSKGFGSSG